MVAYEDCWSLAVECLSDPLSKRGEGRGVDIDAAWTRCLLELVDADFMVYASIRRSDREMLRRYWRESGKKAPKQLRGTGFWSRTNKIDRESEKAAEKVLKRKEKQRKEKAKNEAKEEQPGKSSFSEKVREICHEHKEQLKSNWEAAKEQAAKTNQTRDRRRSARTGAAIRSASYDPSSMFSPTMMATIPIWGSDGGCFYVGGDGGCASGGDSGACCGADGGGC